MKIFTRNRNNALDPFEQELEELKGTGNFASVLSENSPPPPLPEGTYQKSTGSFVPYEVPKPNPNYVYVTDQHAPLQEWRRIGDQIPENMLDQRGIEGAKTWGTQHHNINLANISGFTEEKLNENLGILNQPTGGSREEKIRRFLDAQSNPLGNSSTSSMEDPMQDMRNKRLNYFSSATNNNPLSPPSQNPPQRYQGGTYRLGGGRLSPWESFKTRAWGQNNLANANASRTNVATLGNTLANTQQQTPKQTMGSQSMGAGGAFMMAAPAILGSLMMLNQRKQQERAENQMQKQEQQIASNRM